MRIDIAICTWNRCQLLLQTLERLQQLVIPEGVRWGLLVIDNNSTDSTQAVLSRFARNLPLLSIFEPCPGQAYARNRALHETQADYLIWTDDDVLVNAAWLAAYARAFRTHPDSAFFGGPVVPWFEGTPPRWLAEHWRHIANVFAVRQFGSESFAFDSARVPFGANYAVKVSIQRRYPYDGSLGLRPGSAVRGEETETLRRMLEDGHTGWWVPDAAVQHFVPHGRQTVSYVREFFIGQGELEGRREDREAAPQLLGRPRWLLRRAIEAEARYRWCRLTGSPEVWLPRLAEAAIIWGRLRAIAARQSASVAPEPRG